MNISSLSLSQENNSTISYYLPNNFSFEPLYNEANKDLVLYYSSGNKNRNKSKRPPDHPSPPPKFSKPPPKGSFFDGRYPEKVKEMVINDLTMRLSDCRPIEMISRRVWEIETSRYTYYSLSQLIDTANKPNQNSSSSLLLQSTVFFVQQYVIPVQKEEEEEENRKENNQPDSRLIEEEKEEEEEEGESIQDKEKDKNEKENKKQSINSNTLDIVFDVYIQFHIPKNLTSKELFFFNNTSHVRQSILRAFQLKPAKRRYISQLRSDPSTRAFQKLKLISVNESFPSQTIPGFEEGTTATDYSITIKFILTSLFIVIVGLLILIKKDHIKKVRSRVNSTSFKTENKEYDFNTRVIQIETLPLETSFDDISTLGDPNRSIHLQEIHDIASLFGTENSYSVDYDYTNMKEVITVSSAGATGNMTHHRHAKTASFTSTAISTNTKHFLLNSQTHNSSNSTIDSSSPIVNNEDILYNSNHYQEKNTLADDDDVSINTTNTYGQDIIVVDAPSGKLGIFFDFVPSCGKGGPPMICDIRQNSALKEHVQVGDRLLMVDGIDVTSLNNSFIISNLIQRKSTQPSRRLVFSRSRLQYEIL